MVFAGSNALAQLNQVVLNSNEISVFRTDNVHCISRDGKRIKFVSPGLIEKNLNSLMQKFDLLIKNSSTKEDLAKAYSTFWIGFISIHPFDNGNGRTAKQFIKNHILESKHLRSISDLNFLDSKLLVGDLRTDFVNIYSLFISLLTKDSLL